MHRLEIELGSFIFYVVHTYATHTSGMSTNSYKHLRRALFELSLIPLLNMDEINDSSVLCGQWRACSKNTRTDSQTFSLFTSPTNVTKPQQVYKWWAEKDCLDNTDKETVEAASENWLWWKNLPFLSSSTFSISSQKTFSIRLSIIPYTLFYPHIGSQATSLCHLSLEHWRSRFIIASFFFVALNIIFSFRTFFFFLTVILVSSPIFTNLSSFLLAVFFFVLWVLTSTSLLSF